jgi:DNA-binding MarR family transcriptional regulator
MGETALPHDGSLFFKLVRVVNLTARPFHEGVAKQHHLSLNDWRVMVVLASNPGLAATDVSELTGLDKMSVSRALGALLRHKRLRRQADTHDQRKHRLYLTAVGRRLFSRIGLQAREREAQLFAAVSPDELAQMSLTLDKLVGALKAAEPGA